jgi:hypothetical protein
MNRSRPESIPRRENDGTKAMLVAPLGIVNSTWLFNYSSVSRSEMTTWRRIATHCDNTSNDADTLEFW